MFNNFNSQIKISLHIRSINPLSTKNLKFWCISALSSFFLYILYLYLASWKVFFLILVHYKYLSPFNFRIFTNLISLPGKKLFSTYRDTLCCAILPWLGSVTLLSLFDQMTEFLASGRSTLPRYASQKSLAVPPRGTNCDVGL